jgi:hypothetical protein
LSCFHILQQRHIPELSWREGLELEMKLADIVLRRPLANQLQSTDAIHCI